MCIFDVLELPWKSMLQETRFGSVAGAGRSLFLCGVQCCACLGHQVCWLCGARACLRGTQLWSICTTQFSVQSQFLREKGFFKVLKYNNQRKWSIKLVYAPKYLFNLTRYSNPWKTLLLVKKISLCTKISLL
jgi:hypothetical protein